MPTLKHGTTTNVRVTKGDEVIFSGRCDVAHGEDGTWSLTPVPLPEEPPLYTVVHVPSLNQWQRWTRLDQPTGRNWVDNRADWSSWEQVCALGTPEVLEPDSVKALREQLRRARFHEQNNYSNMRNAEEKVQQAETERNAALSILADVEERARAWAEKDAEPVDDRGLAILSTINRLGREILHLLDATEDEPAEPAPVEVTEEPKPNGRVRTPNGDVWRRLEGCRDWHNDTFPRGECESWGQLRERGPLTLVETGGQS